MTKIEFLELFKEIIQTDMVITFETPLADIEEWDSMAIMAIIAHFDATYGKHLNFEQLQSLSAVGEIAHFVPDMEI